MATIKDLLVILVSSSLISNVVLSVLRFMSVLRCIEKGQHCSGHGSGNYFRYYLGLRCDRLHL